MYCNRGKRIMSSIEFTAGTRRLGILSAVDSVLLGVTYAFTLVAGLLSLQSPQQLAGDPHFSILELLILMTPIMVVLMVTVHAWTSPETKTCSLAAVVFCDGRVWTGMLRPVVESIRKGGQKKL
jgi:hypothetical protein